MIHIDVTSELLLERQCLAAAFLEDLCLEKDLFRNRRHQSTHIFFCFLRVMLFEFNQSAKYFRGRILGRVPLACG
jgi:hypothetical protein